MCMSMEDFMKPGLTCWNMPVLPPTPPPLS